MARNARQVRVAAGGGDIWYAPVGTTLPDDLTTPLDGAFVDGGFITEEGATFSYTPEITEHRAWQSASPIRRDLTAIDISVRATLQEYKASNLVFAFGGGEVTQPRPGVNKYEFPTDESTLEECALVTEWLDGRYHFRLVLPRGNVSEGVESQLTRTDISVLPVTFRALGGSGNGVYLLTDDPAFEPEGS